LSQGNWTLIQDFRNNDEYIIVAGNKKLGPCIIFRFEYIKRGCKEHIGNEQNYKELTKEGAFTCQRGLQIQLRNFISKFGPREEHQEPPDYECISKADDTCLGRAVNSTLTNWQSSGPQKCTNHHRKCVPLSAALVR